MKKTGIKKEQKEKKSAKSIILTILSGANVPSDDVIIQKVLAECKKQNIPTKFNTKQLAWYKYQYRLGRWHDGQRQVIKSAEFIKVRAKINKALNKKLKPVKVIKTNISESPISNIANKSE